jgi:hypothetical protein
MRVRSGLHADKEDSLTLGQYETAEKQSIVS